MHNETHRNESEREILPLRIMSQCRQRKQKYLEVYEIEQFSQLLSKQKRSESENGDFLMGSDASNLYPCAW